MTSLVGDLATDPASLDLDDKHNLSASGGRGEQDYDCTDPNTVVGPYGTFNSRGIWFDRDGVDQWQAQDPLNIDGATYNTGGVYEVVIKYHAITPTLGTMFATVNGIPTTFDASVGGLGGEPAGLSFTGDMTQMQLFYGAWYTGGAGGPVTVSDICLTPSVRATDNCDSDPTITGTRSDGLPLTDPFPQGTTTITWTATDACGNSASCPQTVTVTDQNELLVDVELKSVFESSLTRCITFELFDCSGPASVTVSKELTFTNGVATGVSVLVPCGVYDCITARDTLHTLRRTDDDGDFQIVGSTYVADFTSSGSTDDALIGGNLNDDPYIDILDFGVFSSQWNVNYGTGDTTCSTVPPHADVSGNGIVYTEDFTFIQTNFLTFRDPNCCGLPNKMRTTGGEDPVTEISVAELRARGLGHLAVGDLNRDGWLDVEDLQAFQQGKRPRPLPVITDPQAVELPAPREAAPLDSVPSRSGAGQP
jgi:hypothetical protein